MRAPRNPVSDAIAAHALVGRLDDLSQARGAGVDLNVGILLWPRFPLLSLGGLCDALRHAADRGDQSRQLRCVWTTIGPKNGSVESSCGVAVPVQSVFPPAGQFDYIVAIGGLLSDMDQVGKQYWTYLREAAESKVPLIGILFSVWLLSELAAVTWMVFLLWVAIGLVIYFAYGIRKSKLAGSA